MKRALKTNKIHNHIQGFSRGHATLHLVVSVGWSVTNVSKIARGFRITAPAQPSATGFPCNRVSKKICTCSIAWKPYLLWEL